MSANAIIRYFDLQSARRPIKAVTHGAGGPSFPVWPQYLALVAGIVVQPYLNYYVQHGEWSISLGSIVGRVAFGLIVGCLAFPAVYKNAFDPGKPLFVQLCTIFATGIGWQSVIQGGAKAALGV